MKEGPEYINVLMGIIDPVLGMCMRGSSTIRDGREGVDVGINCVLVNLLCPLWDWGWGDGGGCYILCVLIVW